MARPDFITEEDIARWSKNIDSDSNIPKLIAADEKIREVMYAGLWLTEQLFFKGCSEVNIVSLQFHAGRLSFGRDPWEVHQKALRDYEKLDVNYIPSPAEMN